MKYMSVLIALLFTGVSALFSLTLDITKVYPLTAEQYVFRGCGCVGSLILDLSDQDLTEIDDIDQLLVKYKKKIFSIMLVERLTINLQNNRLKKLPFELVKLSAVSIDVRGNKKLVVGEYFKQQMKSCYFYESNKKESD